MVDASSSPPRLSLCIATYRRANYIGETVRAIIEQATEAIELVVVDGASPDATPAVMTPFAERHPWVRYHRESTNSGVDADFDKAVAYARGDYCWLMSDDDLLASGAIARVLAELEAEPDLLVVNAEIRNADLGTLLAPRCLALDADRVYGSTDRERLFTEVADYLSFIGGVVIRRSHWLARDRAAYYGSLFVHVGVIFQPPALALVKVLAAPLVVIRYGNAMWSTRGFEIWMFKWPRLIWSFPGLPDAAKAAVVRREPWRLVRRLIFHRAIGAYSMDEYRRFLSGLGTPASRFVPWLVAACPAAVANAAGALFWLVRNRQARAGIYDLARSRHATAVARWLARKLDIESA